MKEAKEQEQYFISRKTTPEENRTMAGFTGVVVIGLLAVFIYSPYLNLPLYTDDYRWLRWAKDFFADPSSLFILEAAMFRIICKLCYALLWLVAGSTAWVYHAIDMVFLWWSAALVYQVFRQLRLGVAAALVAALVQVLHPYHLGAFLICGSTTGYLGWALYLLALNAYLRFRSGGRNGDYLLAFTAFTMGLFVKESMVTLPLMLVVYEILNWDGKLKRPVRRLLPFFVLVGFFLMAQMAVQQATYFSTENNYNFGYAYHNYAKSMMGLYNPFWRQINTKYFDLIPHIIAVAVLGFGGRRSRFFALWMYITYLPFALIAWGHETRFLLIPSFGFAGLIGLVFQRFWLTRWRPVLYVVVLLFIVVSWYGINLSELPSWYVTEAAKAKLPVIATNVGGIPEIIVDMQTGMLIRPKNSSEIAKGIAFMAEDKTRRVQLGEALNSYVGHNFSFERMLEGTKTLYNL